MPIDRYEDDTHTDRNVRCVPGQIVVTHAVHKRECCGNDLQRTQTVGVPFYVCTCVMAGMKYVYAQWMYVHVFVCVQSMLQRPVGVQGAACTTLLCVTQGARGTTHRVYYILLQCDA